MDDVRGVDPGAGSQGAGVARHWWRIQSLALVAVLSATGCAGDDQVTPGENVDKDGDGVPDVSDNCADAVNAAQWDQDDDGVGDACDNCFGVPNPDQTDADGNGVGDRCDVTQAADSDGDGVVDDKDNCRTVANPDQMDRDGDSYGDACDNCAGVANYDQEIEICNSLANPEGDLDGDGILNSDDNCPELATDDQTDTDGDTVGDACDSCPTIANANQELRPCEDPEGPEGDVDGDGVANIDDNCREVANDQADADGDGQGDACDACPALPSAPGDDSECLDTDGDGTPDLVDNCPEANPDQRDQDGDGFGDACDTCVGWANADQDVSACQSRDDDGDGVDDAVDNCKGVANDQSDRDGDGVGDVCDNCADVANADQAGPAGSDTGTACQNPYDHDRDSDGDGKPDIDDNCPSRSNRDQQDRDGDGVGNACDNCPGDANPFQEDLNGDGVGDHCQPLPAQTPFCADARTRESVLEPNLYLLIDASGSMRDAKDGLALNRWDRMLNALDSMAPELTRDFNVGLGVFPRRSPGPGDDCASGVLPDEYLRMGGDYSAQQFRNAYSSIMPGSTTPTSVALEQVLERESFEMQGDDEPLRSRAVVLLTDGEPNSPSGEMCDFYDKGLDETIAAARALATRPEGPVPVYVIGFANVNPDAMRAIARAGDPFSSDADYFPATDTDDIVAALRAITVRTAACTIPLMPDDAVDFTRVGVDMHVDGEVTPIPRNANDGFTLDVNGPVVHLHGRSCADLRAALAAEKDAYVTVHVACPSCVASAEECNFVDDNCDGRIDEVCGPPEICDGQDNDRDGEVDEGCGCRAMPEQCSPDQAVDDDCDGQIDEGCPVCVPRPERCDPAGTDEDCDGLVDEGCPVCVPSREHCNGVDDDCNGEIDEGCTPPPTCEEPEPEVCNELDDDCDGRIDEGCVTAI